jgi:Putative prokaryotic signal transducing protein
MENKIVEIARFSKPEDAHILESLLKSEGIECYLRNEFTTQVLYPANMGGVRVELLESEVSHAMEVMEANGYEFPKEDEEAEQIEAVSGWARHIPFLRNYSLEKQIILLFLAVAVFLALFIYFGSNFSS